jgi:hypothetical protein
VNKLIEEGILQEITGRRQDRMFVGLEVLRAINRDEQVDTSITSNGQNG